MHDHPWSGATALGRKSIHTLKKRDIDDRAMGALVGLAVGDALGFPAAFLTPAELRRRYGRDGIVKLVASDFHPRGSVSDDTRTAVATAKAIGRTRELGVDALGLATAAELVRWFAGAALDRAPDATLMRSISRLEDGVPWRGSGDPASRTAGALSRAVPVGIAFRGDAEKVVAMAQATCFPTHAHPLTVGSNVILALLVAYAVAGEPPTRWLRRLQQDLGPLSSESGGFIRTAFRRKRTRPERVGAALGDGWMADGVLAQGLHIALHHDTYDGAVIAAANAAGDSAALGAVAGALAGAIHGYRGIPRSLKAGVELGADLKALAVELAAA